MYRQSLRLLTATCVISTLPYCSSALGAVTPEGAAEAQRALYSARYDRAIELYSNLLKQDPAWAAGYYGLVRALIEGERSREADEISKEGLRSLPDSAETQAAAGLVSYRQGDIVEAEKYFLKSRTLNPKYPGALEGLARINRCVSRFKTAKNLEKAAFDLSPEDPSLMNAWANTLKGEEHIAALQKLIALYDPASRQAQRLRAHIATDRALANRKVRQLESSYQSYQIKLDTISDGPQARSVRGAGVRVKVNGRQTVHLLLDTGASGIAITPKAAQRAGLEVLGNETSSARGIGDSKEQESSRYLASTLQIGELRYSNFVVSAFRSARDSDIDGLIGADVFERFLVTIDFPHMQLLLDPYPDRPGPGDEPEDAGPVPAGFSRVIRFGTHLTLHTLINENAKRLFLIDSGSSSNLIDSELAAKVTKIHADPNTTVKGIQGRVKDVQRARKISLLFAGFHQDNPDLIAVDLNKQGDGLGAAIGGIIGMPVLWNLKVTIDYRAGAIRLVMKGGA